MKPWLNGGRRRSLLAGLIIAGLVCTLIAAVGWPREARAAALPANFQARTVLSGLTMPTNVEFSPDGRVFVAEKSGIIKVFDSLADTSATVFADLRPQTFNGWDRGLLGLALHPNFPNDPRIYVSYTYNGALGGTYPRWPSPDGSNDQCPDPPGANDQGCVVAGRISVLTQAVQSAGALKSQAAANPTERVLLEDYCQQFPSHSVGTLAFGADGMLYAGGGDGASFRFADYGQTGNPCGDPPRAAGTNLTAPGAEGGALRSQDRRTPSDPTTLDGTIVRLDPDTAAPAGGNPSTTGDLNNKRIVADGLRNPYRFTLRPGTNEVWLGDVGYTNWEEINRIVSPTTEVRNFGWPCYEGNGRTAGYDAANLAICENLYTAGTATAPYYTYKHSDLIVPGEACNTGSSSISGMAFYAGSTYPAAYRGGLFFTDYARDCVWVMKTGTNGLPDRTKIETFATDAGALVELQAGPGGDLFAVDISAGRIVRYTYNGVNNPPIAMIKSNVTSGSLPLTVNFDGTASSDTDANTPLTYAWDLDGDGAFDDSTAAKPTHTYTSKGSYTVRLRVTDTRGGTDTTTATITAGSTPPVATIESPGGDLTWKVGDTIPFRSKATDAEDGNLTGTSLKWDIIMHHCPSNCHVHTITGQDGASGEFVAPDHEHPSWLELRLTATDTDGLTDVRSVELHPKTTTVTLASTPAGAPLTFLETTGTAPFNATAITGSTVSISAPAQTVLVGGRAQEFASWSDGGAATHNITVPVTATTLTAAFRAKTNLAQGRPIAASSVERAGFEAAKANDGSTTTRWSSARTDPQSITVDLGSSRAVGTVLLRWEAAYAKSFRIDVSNDNRTWSIAYANTNGDGGIDFISFTPRNVRYVRMNGLKRATSYGYSLFEFEIFDR